MFCNCLVGLACAEEVLRSEPFICQDLSLIKGFDGSFFDFLRNGLFALNGLLEKKPDLRFVKPLSGEADMPGICTPLTGGCLTGETVPDIGSALVKDEGFE